MKLHINKRSAVLALGTKGASLY